MSRHCYEVLALLLTQKMLKYLSFEIWNQHRVRISWISEKNGTRWVSKQVSGFSLNKLSTSCLRDQLCLDVALCSPSVPETQRHLSGWDLPVLFSICDMCSGTKMVSCVHYYKHFLLFVWSLRDLKSFCCPVRTAWNNSVAKNLGKQISLRTLASSRKTLCY